MPNAIEYPGIPAIRGIDFAFSRGVSPSAFTLYALPFDGLNVPPDTLSISIGGFDVAFSGCAINTAFIRKRHDGRHPLWAVTGFDRRWRWKFSSISGDWNRRLSDGTVDPNTAKTPAELAGLLLNALGEGGYDTSKMPSNVRPRALWKSQRADLMLQALCDYVACEVVLNPLTDRVEIWPLGVGGSAPDGASLAPKYRHVPRSNVPATVEVRGGDSLFQSKLQIKAVVRDYTTGNRKLIENSEFKPSTGWDKESPFSFPGISSTNNRINAYDQVWREFQINGQQDGSLTVPNCQESISSTDQYLLNDYLLEVETDLSQFKRNLPCFVDGDYYAWTDLPNNASSHRYSGAFELQKDRRIVKFPFPMFKLSSSGAFQEPTLYLTTSYRVKSVQGEVVAIKRQGNVGGSGGNLILRRPELFAIYSTSQTPNAQTNTEAQANQEADAYVSLFQQKYSNATAAEVTYAGIVPVSLDGNIAQVTWSFAMNRAPTTMVCESEELDAGAISRNERRRNELVAQLAEGL